LRSRRTSRQQLPLTQCTRRTASSVRARQHSAQQRCVQGK
jgi:hypothetical protein